MAAQGPTATVLEETSEQVVDTMAQGYTAQHQQTSEEYEPARNDNDQSIFDSSKSDTEKSVILSDTVLDRSRDVKTERKQRYKKVLQSHIPEELQGEGKKEEEVMQLVDQLIFYEEANGEEVQINESAQLQDLDETGKLTITAHSLAAHFTTLEPSALERAACKLEADCKLWLSRLFRFKSSVPVYHDRRYEGLTCIGRLALYTKFPKYATEGFEALYSRPPVIYISAAAPPGLGQYLCQQLGLPLSCSCTVPCYTLHGPSSKMDVALLEKLIQDDIAAAKTPVLLVAYAGTPVVGHVDNIQRLQELSKTNNIWLHVDGNSLATLAMFSVPSSVESATVSDSFTLDLTNWLGVPSLSYITLFKESDRYLTDTAGLTTTDPRFQLKCLPLWMCLQSLGHEGAVGKIKYSCELAKTLYDDLDKINTVRQISRERKKQDRELTNMKNLFSKPVSALLVFEIVTPTVVFKYKEDTSDSGAPFSGIKMDNQNDDKDDAYFDALNTWLAEALQASNPRVPIDLVEVDKEGVCIRYSPLESAQVRGTTKEDIEDFLDSLKSNLSVLDATTVQRKRFRTIVSSHNNLRLIDLDSWAGLGAASYIPEMYVNKQGDFTDKEKIEINNLNAELVHRLKAQDTAFSTGQANDGIICVRFGLITSETDIDELVSLVCSSGKEVEESSKFLESMSEMIRRGIEEASKELEKENTEKLLHEGILRQVPVVSSLLNWFSPVKDQIKGRTFNLTSGKIIPTTDTYKYHMQIQEDGSAPLTFRSAKERIQNTSVSSSKGTSQEDAEPPELQRQSSTTAGQVKAQLVSQALSASPSSPTQPTPPASSPQKEIAGVSLQQENVGTSKQGELGHASRDNQADLLTS
ncbi:hypothetical protein BsWGS_06539 [Bradybaena similaris]